METLLHIGASKAASSFLQDNVFGNLGMIKYHGPTSEYACRVVKWITESKACKPCGKSGIVSHEGLSIPRDINGIPITEKINSVWKNIRVLYVIREQKDWLVSRYNQDRKTYMGVCTGFFSFDKWLKGKFHDELSRSLGKPSQLYKPKRRLRYDRLIHQFLERNIDIKVVQYENILENPSLVIGEICEWIGVSVPNVTYERKNTSMSDVELIIDKYFKIITGGSKLIKRVSRGVLSQYDIIDYSIENDVNLMIKNCNNRLENMGYSLHPKYEI